jgi:hypothetical protein
VLADGLDRVGSTGARVQIAAVGAAADLPVVTAGEWLVVLESETVMGERSEHSPERVYADYWRDVAAAEMIDFMAQQALRGDFLGMRGKNDYRPHFVTTAGSAFRLRITDLARFTALVRGGLPPRWGGVRPGWEDCPFQPENGWGRISLEKLGT